MSKEKQREHLVDAISAALQGSQTSPDKYFHVLVRDRERPRVTGDGCERSILVAEGWKVVVTYKDGTRVLTTDESEGVVL